MQAMGDAGAKRFVKLEGDTIASSEALLFLLNPKMSYVSKDFAAADPGFWNPKPLENGSRRPQVRDESQGENGVQVIPETP